MVKSVWREYAICTFRAAPVVVSLLVFGSVPSLVTGCGMNAKPKKVVKECVLPDDQKGTLSGKWRLQPIPIAFHSGDFDGDEAGISAAIAAADTWNAFFKASLGIEQVLDYGEGSSPRATSIANSALYCPRTNQPPPGSIPPAVLAPDAGDFGSPVAIYKLSNWPEVYSSSAIALTSYCQAEGNPLPNLTNAKMELNYQHFFKSGVRQPDLESIFLHEFGHLLGLDHSCDTTGRTGFPKCGASLPEEYFEAVMYPIVLFDDQGFGELRRETQPNDQGRANCVYQEPAT